MWNWKYCIIYAADANTNLIQASIGTDLYSARLIFVDVSIYPFCLILGRKINIVKYVTMKLKKEPYHENNAAINFPGPSKIKDDEGGTPQWYCSWSQLIRALTSHLSRWPFGDLAGTASSHDARHLFKRVTINSVFEKGSSIPNTVEAALCNQCLSNQTSKIGYSNSLWCTRFQDTLCSTQYGCVTQQNLTPETPYCH